MISSALALGALGAVGYGLLSTERKEKEKEEKNTNENPVKNDDYRDLYENNMSNFSEMGISYSSHRPTLMELANVNDAYHPISAPKQESTYSVPDVLSNQAATQALLADTVVPFFFDSQQNDIFLGSNTQKLPTVMVPTENSIMGDPGASLMNYPLTFVEGQRASQGAWDKAGVPTERNAPGLRDNGKVLLQESNPWGPGGTLQRMFNGKWENDTRRKGANQSKVFF